MNKKEKLLEFQLTRTYGKRGVITRIIILRDFLIKAKDETLLDYEFLKLIPVAIVSAYEAFFKYVFAAYIDKSEKYLNRSILLTGDKDKIIIEFDILTEVGNKRISIGEVIAMSLKYSRPETIIGNLNKLLFESSSESFYNRIKTISSKSLYNPNENLEELEQFVKNPGKHFKSFQSVFDIRHKYIHEFMSSRPLEFDEVLEMLDLNINFMNAVDRMIWEDLYSDIALTQVDLHEQAFNYLEETTNQLSLITSRYFDELKGKDLVGFKALTKSWDEIMERTSKFFSKQYALGGSMYPMTYALSLVSLKKRWIEYLEDNAHLLEK